MNKYHINMFTYYRILINSVFYCIIFTLNVFRETWQDKLPDRQHSLPDRQHSQPDRHHCQTDTTVRHKALTYRQHCQTQTDIHRHTDRHTYRQTDRQTDRQTYIHTYIQTDRQTDRQTDSLQPISSDRSGQSPSRSHRYFCWMHMPLRQRNSSGLHGQSASSESSSQSLWPSHVRLYDTHRLLLHVK